MRQQNMKRTQQLILGALAVAAILTCSAADKKLILIAGRPSHGAGEHEFRAGCLLLQKSLERISGLETMVYSNGWPQDAASLQDADAVVIYADGGGGHPGIQGEHLKVLGDLIKRGVGFGCMHYACEVPKDKGGKEWQDWIGGYYEDRYSVNPMWTPEYKAFPDHPVTRGVKAFGVLDEWYFNMRWRADMKDVVPILVAKPSDAVRDGPYVWPKGPYPHIQANKGREETMMWVVENPGGARGFGFTGGHYHKNWGDPNFRKVVLNAMLWIARAEVPAGGINSEVAEDQLRQNLDPKGKN
jgi:type 1 glutamine amidotransferase